MARMILLIGALSLLAIAHARADVSKASCEELIMLEENLAQTARRAALQVRAERDPQRKQELLERYDLIISHYNTINTELETRCE